MSRPACLVRDGAALRHNVRVAMQRSAGASLYAVVKADAYGHGAVWAARHALEAGARGVAVACLEEAAALRDANINQPILLLEGAVDADETHQALRMNLDVVIHCDDQLPALEAAAECGGQLWLKIDTGMNRLGVSAAEAASVWERISRVANSGRPPGLMSHFASADEPTNPSVAAQLQCFNVVAQALDARVFSIANSAATLSLPECFTSRGEHWARPGLMLYGVSPFADRTGQSLGLEPVASFTSALISVKTLKSGERVGYGGVWCAERETVIGVVAAGYADGYPRVVAPGTSARVNGEVAPLAGRVSMDMLIVDLTDLAVEARRGDPVELWGLGVAVEEVAAAAGTIAYELMCRPAPRVRRLER